MADHPQPDQWPGLSAALGLLLYGPIVGIIQSYFVKQDLSLAPLTIKWRLKKTAMIEPIPADSVPVDCVALNSIPYFILFVSSAAVIELLVKAILLHFISYFTAVEIDGLQ